jgi:ubiquinone/menaquinone biosynthesis C-methylase UbiE
VSENPVVSGYDLFYAAWARSPTLRRIWRDHVTGPDYPEEFAHISFVRLADLRTVAEGLSLATGKLLVDLACGAGGPGFWVAKESGARLVGRDVSPVAVERAAERVSALGMDGRVEFGQGSFEETRIESGSADAVMTIDALQYAPDKAKALAEMARILRPRGRLAIVAFELDADRIAGFPVWSDPVGDYRPLLEHVGFEILRYEQIPNWQEQVTAGFGEVLAARGALEEELGPAAAALMLEASTTLELRPYRGHVFALAALI